jgi:hypothetical protein
MWVKEMKTNEHVPQHVDYDLHGLAGVRLINATEADVAVVNKQLGPIQKPLEREPDVIIRFVDQLSPSSSLRYLGLDEVGFTEDSMLLLENHRGKHARVQIPFERIGRRCEIVCERGVPKVPLLIPILNLTVLSNGAIPLHAAAFTYNGTGIVVTGWAKGGKTETLLAFMDRGAVYVGDEWVYISGDGQHMYGIPEPIRVWSSHLQDLPRYRAKIALRDRARLQALKLMVHLTERKIKNSVLHASASATASRLLRLVKRQQYVHLPPQRLFGPVGPFTGTPDKIFYVVSHETADVKVEPISSEEVARRMVFSLQHERIHFMSHYLKFRFAFPEARNEFIERVEEIERDMLLKVLAAKPTYVVYHPYPAPIPALFEAISPFVAPSVDKEIQLEKGTTVMSGSGRKDEQHPKLSRAIC